MKGRIDNAIDEDGSMHTLNVNSTAQRRGVMYHAGCVRRTLRARAPIGQA